MANLDMALVVGAAGGIGGEMVRALRGAGWRVRALARSAPPAGDGAADIDWRLGDASNPHDVAEAARGCAAIVHAVNPPGYRRWSEWVLPMLENTIAAAKRERATIVLPGTVYNYGPDAGGLLREDSPQHPLTRKGAIRVEMERRLRDATEAGARVLIVRAGDFFGPGARNNWFSQGLVKPGRPVRTVRAPGRAGVGHQWAYLPDVAQAMVELLARRDALDAFSCFHLAGHWDADGTRMSAPRSAPPRRGARASSRASPPSRGGSSRSRRRSSRPCAKCARCAIYGAKRCAWTMQGSSPRSAASRTRRSKPRSRRRSTRSAA
ncbi:NAD-dependent epimerase/dehydratase family protein [Burkholderia pseudomallei]|nr:NAD-dependent epimerase/dehydratase family protein [Burkholderia pseudomallei]CAJ3547065.1 NAD-dependent epimerase/dehydratase family protein [Burkholderia pseudomallei]CAJ4192707.1 NAD-dependent epimerase/dehydratase family protein [Burkholderia pseudomallei]CAJ4458868.1 NAD-dependent epimerase/dehydratase family protein [Burkholderia pseudomallei]CAJ5144952.1 NAD-dependent epimerase/dehydratase family protein [Burkholderia pseudomallei]